MSDHEFVDARSDPAAVLPWAPAGCTCGWRSTPSLYTFIEDVRLAWVFHVEDVRREEMRHFKEVVLPERIEIITRELNEILAKIAPGLRFEFVTDEK